jgi:hypothetical protein
MLRMSWSRSNSPVTTLTACGVSRRGVSWRLAAVELARR